MPPARLRPLLLALAAGPLAGCFVDAGHVTSGAWPDSSTDSSTSSTADATTTATRSTSSTADSTTAPGVCGDGVLDPDEACDGGSANNGLHGSVCRLDCQLNHCGDGYLASIETCDDGNLLADDGCGPTCKLEGCGDGVLQRGEACDDGNLAPDDACTDLCEPAACGDGIVQVGVEGCDDGNLAANDGCSDACQVEACGDGIIQRAEVCDDGNLVAGDGCSPVCQRDAAFVFVTSTTSTGNLGGVVGGNSTCAALAAAAGLPGSYAVWLSTGSSSPLQRFKPAQLPYILPGGTPVAASWADLLDGSLAHPIDRHQDGTQVAAAAGYVPANLAWTNTKASGSTYGDTLHCAGWTSGLASTSGRAGRLDAVTGEWSSSCSQACNQRLHLYCVEQGP